MQKILQLSHCDLNFTVNPSDELIQLLKFNFREKVPQVMSLLSLDHNLARLHAKISPKMDEEIFWRNYYARIYYLRYLSGIDSPPATPFLDNLAFEEVVFFPKSGDSSPGKMSSVAATPPQQAVAMDSLSKKIPPPPSPQPMPTPLPSSPPSPPPNSRSSPNATGGGNGSSSDWDTCDDIKDSKTTSTKKVESAQSKKLNKDIENMKKEELERMKQREAEAAALAAEVPFAFDFLLFTFLGCCSIGGRLEAEKGF